jgi:hypothetical protein
MKNQHKLVLAPHARSLAGDLGNVLPAQEHWGLSQRVLAQLPRYLKYIRDDPAWALVFSLGRLSPVRWITRHMAASHEPVTEPSALFPDLDETEVTRVLERDGIYCGLRLQSEIVQAILAFAETNPCFGNIDQNMPFLMRDHDKVERSLGRAVLVGHYLDQLKQCAAAMLVLHDPALYRIACRYLRAKAVRISSRLWWSFPTTQECDDGVLVRASQEIFHFDLEDWRSLKFFFQLTDVDARSGPHVYVRQSHRLRGLQHQFTILKSKPEKDILSYYGKDRLVHVCGPAGFGFAEDPFGYHMGTVAKDRPRLMLDVEFGISPSRIRHLNN